METYPSGLQQKLNADNFNIMIGDTTMRSGMDVGPDKVRSRYTDAVDMYTVSIWMDIDDYDTLTTFFKSTLGNGVKTFGFTNPMTGDSDEFRFMGPPQIMTLGGRTFSVSMKWERLP